jgi:protein phosphatase
MRFQMAGRTDLGRKRKNNEDALFFSEEEGFAIVADGMGGLHAGEVASQTAVQALAAHFVQAWGERRRLRVPPPELLGRFTIACREWLHTINAELWLAATSRERKHKMGSTVAFFAECADHAVIGNMGDSRVYRLRDGKLQQLSTDHSWAAEDAESVPEGEGRRAKRFVTRALGIQSKIEPEFLVEKLRRGDVFLLCSDGLTEDVSDEEIGASMGNAGDDLWSAVQRLIDMALLRGAPDNISVILARAVG